MSRRRTLVVGITSILVIASWSSGGRAQSGRSEVEPEKAITTVEPALFAQVSPGTSFTYRVTLKKNKSFNTANGDGVEINDVSGNLEVGGSRKMSDRVWEVDITSQNNGQRGSAEVRIKFTTKKGKLKFTLGGILIAVPVSNQLVTIATDSRTVTQALENVGSRPWGVVDLADSLRRVFVCNNGENTVSVVDVSTNSLFTKVTVGSAPVYDDVAGTLGAQSVYVTNSGSNTVSVIDAESLVVVATITVGNSPWGVAIVGSVSTGERAYVANRLDDTVSVINVATNAVIATIPVGDEPMGVAVAGVVGGETVVVTNSGDGTISLINANTNTVTFTVAVGSNPVYAVVGGDARDEIWVVNRGSDDVSLVDLTSHTQLSRVSVGAAPQGAAMTGATLAQFVYVTNSGDGTVSVIDANARSNVGTVLVGGVPRGASGVGPTSDQDVVVTN
jgi:YVTN family beta-propeller protein